MKTLESAGWTALGNGYYKQTNFKSRAVVLKGGELTMRLYFATVILQSAKPISGEKQSRAKNGKIAVLMRSDTSSLVVDRLCDKVKERNMAVACFYVDFAARKENLQQTCSILS